MIGVIVNTVLIVAGSLIGLLCKKGLPQKLIDSVMMGLGVCVVYIGITGALKGRQTLLIIVSMVLGIIIGTAVDIDDKLNRLGEWVNRKLSRGDGGVSLADGFVSGSLLFCVGAMAVVGSLNAGLLGDNQTLFTKALIDCVSAAMMTVTLGIGVVLSAVSVFVYQGAIVMLAGLLEPVLTDWAVCEITCVGSLMIMCIGLNMMKITKIKVANMLPAVIFAPLLCTLWDAVSPLL